MKDRLGVRRRERAEERERERERDREREREERKKSGELCADEYCYYTLYLQYQGNMPIIRKYYY